MWFGHSIAVLVTGQGYALLDKLRSITDPAERQRCLDDAAGPLFRAAADLAAPGQTADGRESYVRGLLGVLAADMMGSYQPEGPEACCRFLACFVEYMVHQSLCRRDLPAYEVSRLSAAV